MGFLVAAEQPAHRERDVQRVLHVVVDRVATGIPGKLALEHALEIDERALDRDKAGVGVHGAEDMFNGAPDFRRLANPDLARYVEFAGCGHGRSAAPEV